MSFERQRAVFVGVLFIVALATNLIASQILDPIIGVPDYLSLAYPKGLQVIAGNALNILAAISMMLIPVALFPIARRQNPSLSVGYGVFRSLEGVLFIFMAVETSTLINSSKAFLESGAQSAPVLQMLGASTHAALHWAMIIYIVIFIFGAMTFYSLLLQSRLVPRLLSTWGILGSAVLGIGVVLAVCKSSVFATAPLMQGMVYFAPPIALNELVLSIWLIAKGFDSVQPAAHHEEGGEETSQLRRRPAGVCGGGASWRSSVR